MLQRSRCLFGRSTAKGGKLWSPLGAKATSAPGSVISGAEMIGIFYRQLPSDRTVESEEDFGHNLLLHREFVSKRAKREGALSWDEHPAAPSAVEQRVGKATIAQGVNEHRREAARAKTGFTPVLQVSNDIQAAPGSIESARYVFDEPRMQYCDRFGRHYPELAGYLALMETAAILFGCETDEAREAWFHFFLQLDRRSFDEIAERRANNNSLVDSMKLSVKPQPKRVGRSDPSGHVASSAVAVSQPASLTESPKSGGEEGDEIELDGEVGDEVHGGVADEADTPIPHELAGIYASYAAYCRGQSPTFGNAQEVIRNADTMDAAVARKLRYRKMLTALVEERPLQEFNVTAGNASSTEVVVADITELAAELDNQLQAMKLYGLRVGEAVKEALTLQERAPGSPQTMRQAPGTISTYNPDRKPQANPM